MNLIEVENLRLGYHGRDVLNLSLTVRRGEFTAILGPNGSGKTTLIRALSGVLPPLAGTIHIAGQNVNRLSAKNRARLTATVAQKSVDPGETRVLSLVLMGRYPYLGLLGTYTEADFTQAQTAMHETACQHLAHRRARTLSGGEFQRVIMAKALTQDTELLLLDEAASNLDVARTVDLYDLLAARNRAGMTILSVAHDLNLAALYCQRLIFLKNGAIAADGPPQTVFTAETLSDIYETPITVAPHPVTGVPQAYLLPGAALAATAHAPGPDHHHR